MYFTIHFHLFVNLVTTICKMRHLLGFEKEQILELS